MHGNLATHRIVRPLYGDNFVKYNANYWDSVDDDRGMWAKTTRQSASIGMAGAKPRLQSTFDTNEICSRIIAKSIMYTRVNLFLVARGAVRQQSK